MSRLLRNLFAPTTSRPFAVLRVGLAALLLVQSFCLVPWVDELYGDGGLVPWSVNEATQPAGVPRVSWAADGLAPLGATPAGALRGVFLAYVAALTCMISGVAVRPAAVAAWLTHLALGTSGWTATYGVDAFANVGLFHLALFPSGWTDAPTAWATAGLRLLQGHLCIAYFASGVEKALGPTWWTGEAFWQAVMRPDFAVWDLSWLAWWPWLAQAACLGTLVIEAGYPLGVLCAKTRVLWPVMAIMLHAGIAVVLGLALFSGVMIVLNVAAFLVSQEGGRRKE